MRVFFIENVFLCSPQIALGKCRVLSKKSAFFIALKLDFLIRVLEN